MTRRPTISPAVWYLEGAEDDSGRPFRVPVTHLPFRIGRDSGLELSLPSQVISSRHAELDQRGRQLVVRDLGSTNGTFVNRIPVEGETRLDDGDVVRFATFTFRLRLAEAAGPQTLTDSTAAIDSRLGTQMSDRLRRLETLLESDAVSLLLQPIVDLSDHEVLGFEVLGRGALEGLPEDIGALFELAGSIGAEVDLSLALRRQSVDLCRALADAHCYFLNTHPAELQDDRLLSSLRQARAASPGLRIAVEIHETAVTEPAGIRELREGLLKIDMLLVYDDFGSGQARLLELAEVPPDFLKFDRSLIHDIDTAPAPRVRLLEGLVKMALELEIDLIAEGLESQEELEVCRELGFAYGQGYLIGGPEPCAEIDGRLVPPRPKARP